MISSSRHALGPPERRGWIARTALILSLVLAAVLPASALTVSAARQAESEAALPAQFCHTWDFANYTGEDADDLHIWLHGVRYVSEVYAGEGNPFGPPAGTSGYDAELNAYRLDFAGGPALAGDTVRLGACTATPALQLGATSKTPPFYWSLQEAVLEPSPLFAGLSWGWGAGGLRLTVTNPGTSGLVLWSLDLLTAEAALPLEDLTGDSLATLPALAAAVDEPVVIPAGGSQSFDIATAALAGAGGALLVELAVSAEDDLDNVAHLYSQAAAPAGVVYLPLMLK